MDWKLELVIVPVSDVDRAKTFYTDQAGFTLDVDHRAGDFRVVQLTPPGSARSITIMANDAARAELIGRGADVSAPYHFDAGGQAPGPDPDRRDYGSFLSFSDPDGNGWLVQEVGRATGASS